MGKAVFLGFVLLVLLLPNFSYSQLFLNDGQQCNKKYLDSIFPVYWNIVGCDCTTIRESANESYPNYHSYDDRQHLGDAYCDALVGNKGKIKECIVDADCAVPGNREIFCIENKCNQCNEDPDCSALAEEFNLDVENSKCIKGELTEKKKCHFCETLAGSGGKVITFVILGPYEYGNEVSEAEALVSTFSKLHPFKYLLENGKITFKVVHERGNDHEYLMRGMSYDDEMPAPFKKSSTDLSRQRNYHLKRETILGTVSEICPGTDLVVFVVRNRNLRALFLYSAEGIKSTSGKDFIFAFHSYNLIMHEFGHALGDLTDEYKITGAMREAGFRYYAYARNIEARSDSVSTCPKFNDELKIPTPNCYRIDKFPDGQTIWKSTAKSIMSTSFPKYNIASCAGILEETGGMDIIQAVDLCKGWTSGIAPNAIINQATGN